MSQTDNQPLVTSHCLKMMYHVKIFVYKLFMIFCVFFTLFVKYIHDKNNDEILDQPACLFESLSAASLINEDILSMG